MSGHLNDTNLIKLVESFPILYDKDQARGIKNAALKDKAWKTVSIMLNASERACITRWKSIRDRFGKEYRRVQENPEVPTYWDLFPHLMFLREHYKHGHASNDPLVEIRYEPRERRRKRRFGAAGDTYPLDEESMNGEDIDPNQLLENQQLIALVKEHPVLYDKQKIRDSKNLTAKNEAWQEISESLSITEEVCYRRWKKLRDRFAREYRNYRISPDKFVTWIYFSDLLFLEEHYRKGVPLPIETMKVKDDHEMAESVWEDDYSIEYPEEVEETEVDGTISDHDEIISEDLQHTSLDDLIVIGGNKSAEETYTELDSLSNEDPPTEWDEEAEEGGDGEGEPVEKLTSVIGNMEEVLQQAQAVLKSLRTKREHQVNENILGYDAMTSIQQKMHLLLEGLRPAQRTSAERKIVQFLCECQIKSLNDEHIEDVIDMQQFEHC